MTEEQIKHTSKITEFARNKVKQSNYPKELQDHIIATCMVVVTEATKELEEENERLLNEFADGYQGSLTIAKEIIRELIDNRPDTYSGTDVELQQKKMFAFQRAVMQAETFLKEDEEVEQKVKELGIASDKKESV